MPTHKNHLRRFVICLGSGLLAIGAASGARADGTSNSMEARATCERIGQAGSAAQLKKCCSDQILVASTKEQKALEAECVAGKANPKAPKPAKAASASN